MNTDNLVELLIVVTFAAVIIIAVLQLLRQRKARYEHSSLGNAKRKLDTN